MHRAGRLVWWALAFVFATASLLAFSRPATPWLDGVVWALLAVICARAAFHRPSPTSDLLPLWEDVWEAAVQRPWRAVSMGAAFVLTVWLVHQLPALPPDSSYRPYVGVWGIAIVFYLLAVAPPRGWPRTDWTIWWEVNQRTAIAGLTIVLLAFLVRLLPLRAPLEPFILRTAGDTIQSPFVITPSGIPSMAVAYTMLGVRLAGTAYGARLAWVLVGTLTVANAFWVGTRLKGVQIGLLCAFLLAIWPLHVQASHQAMPSVALLFFTTLAVLMLQRALDRRSPLDWGWTGIAVAGALYTAPGGWLTGGMVLAILFYLLLAERRTMWVLHRNGMLIAIGAWFLTSAPWLQFVWRTPNRAVLLGIQQGEGALTPFALLAELLNASQPEMFLPPLSAALFLLGLFYATLRLFLRHAEYRMAPMVLWFWGVLYFTERLTTFSTHAVFLAVGVPVLFFIALALWHIALLAQRAWRTISVPAALAAGATLVALVWLL